MNLARAIMIRKERKRQRREGQPDERGCPSRLCRGTLLQLIGNSSGHGGQKGCHFGSGCSGHS